MCVVFLSVNALITIPSVVNDLLIILASSSNVPSAPVFDIFSEPARSTKYSLPVLCERSSKLFCYTVKIKIECDLLDSAFIFVAAIDLTEFPCFIIS